MWHLPFIFCREARLRQLFTEYDSDRSGFISPDEVKKLFDELGMALTDKESERMVFLMEGDGCKDGKVSFEEFLKYYQE